MPIRKGQKLCNWIQDQGYAREDVHIKLFYMSDKEFDKVINMEVDYEIEDHDVANEIIDARARAIIDTLLENDAKRLKEDLD